MDELFKDYYEEQKRLEAEKAQRVMNTTKTDTNYNAQYCINRLPCGYCTLLSRACPMLPTTNVIYTAVNAKEADE